MRADDQEVLRMVSDFKNLWELVASRVPELQRIHGSGLKIESERDRQLLLGVISSAVATVLFLESLEAEMDRGGPSAN